MYQHASCMHICQGSFFQPIPGRSDNIVSVSGVAVLAARPGWRGGRSSGRCDKGHLGERPKACSREHLCYTSVCTLESNARYSVRLSNLSVLTDAESETSIARPTTFAPGSGVSANTLSRCCCVSAFLGISGFFSVQAPSPSTKPKTSSVRNRTFIFIYLTA